MNCNVVVNAISRRETDLENWSEMWDEIVQKENIVPDLVIFCSSAEIGLMSLPSIRNQCQKVMDNIPNARHCFISMACVGLHATILEMRRYQSKATLIFLLETPIDFIQGALNRGGIGDTGDCLKAVGGVGLLLISDNGNSPHNPGEFQIAASEIICKPDGTDGTVKLLTELGKRMREFADAPETRRVISFVIQTSWSQYLCDGFEGLVVPKLPPNLKILPSLEYDQHHYLTLKPLIELQNALSNGEKEPVATVTLAAGGRIGWLTAFPKEAPILPSDVVNAHPIEGQDASQAHKNLPLLYLDTSLRIYNGYIVSELSNFEMDSFGECNVPDFNQTSTDKLTKI